ncbi:hypothetical protein M427DRAFT_32957 [Gonapodya prolifera JEL478]|uniref:Uncharacterized protein n=1 Tax=Gonapodya prolifera (strain JEL478) TaxID=1344416 RepID=A0A139AEA7_GONPJ|nr:hypothetical protein M427DRAFT_32957 [Gonapodya prolifera JEL478]|eukprot:KXS14753.1 hypothetical protein M427DRAFT_32957 [Gonapodya prolifera JEL478]
MQDRKEFKKLLASDRSLWELKLLEEKWNYLEKVRKLLKPMFGIVVLQHTGLTEHP